MEKATKYAELIAQTEENQAAENRELTVESAELELKGHLLALKKTMVDKLSKLKDAKRAIPFNTRNVYAAQTEVDKLNREIKFVEKLSKELF